MPRAKNHEYEEIEHIREDLDSLKNNVVELTKHLKQDSKAQSKEISKEMKTRLQMLQDQGRTHYKNVEKHVQDKPGQSIAIAFAAGLAASMLIGRR